MNIASLKTELTTDPIPFGYAGMTDAQVLASLNTVNRTAKVAISPLNFVRWLAGGTILDNISLAQTTGLTSPVKSAARYVVLLSQAGLGIDPNNSIDVAAINALVTAGVITSAERTTLAAQGSVAASRSVELFGEAVTNQDIYRARRE